MARLRAVPLHYTTTHWGDRAACRGLNDNTFSPVTEKGRLNLPLAREVAQTWCKTCPVLAECRDAVEVMRADNRGPQELVQAGIYWPPTSSRDRKPVPLLDDNDDEDGVAA